MRVEDEIRYLAPPDVVAAMLADPAFVDRKVAATHALSYDVDVVGTPDGGFTVTTRRTMPTDTLPDAARSFVGDTLDIRQVEAWERPSADGARAGSLVVEVVGAPLRLSGMLRLRRDGEGSVQDITGDLTCSVPLLGGRLEKAAYPAFMAAIRKEAETGAAWLQG